MTVVAALPPDEAGRIAALRRYAVLDSAPEACFDRIARLAARKFQVPIALISLIDENRQWFKANCGLDVRETSRDVAFCAHAILEGGVFMVADATKDPRFADNPLVTDGLKIRFYAGAPLVNPEGHRLGTLCLIDTVPRPCLSDDDQILLSELAAIVVDQIEMRYATGDVLREVETRIKAEDELASAEQQLGIFFEYAPVAVAMFDRDIRYLAASRRWLQLFDLDWQGVVGRDHFACAPYLPDDWKARYAHCLEGHALESEEDTLMLPDGRSHWVHHQSRPWRTRDGAIGGLIVFLEIIDTHHHAVEKLERHRRFMEAVLQSIQDGIVACDAEGRLSLFNDAARRMHGLDPEAPLPPSDWAAHYSLYEADGTTPLAMERIPLYRALNGETVVGQEMVIAPPERPRRQVVATGSAMHDGDGRKLGAVASMHDVTREQTAQARYDEASERYRQLYTKTPVMLHSINREGHVISVSDHWLEKLGYDREEVIGRKSTDFLTPDSARRAVEEVLPAFMRDGVCHDVPYQVRTKGGDVLDILLSAVAEYGGDGQVVRSMAVLIDVTDRKAMQQQLIQAQKMESVGQLTGGLAHDFNNLLGVILGNLQLIERSLRDDDRGTRRLNAAINAVERGAELTRRLLAFSRRQKLETVSVEPNALIEGMSDMLKRTLGEEISLHYRLAAEVPSVRVDVSQLESALLNLAVNARDAMPKGGTLTIESQRVHLDHEFAAREHEVTPGDYVAIAVADTGIGIPPEVLHKAFEPFFTTKEIGRGSGLGLSMVYGFIKQSGGHVRVDSEMDKGTTIRLYLPVEPSTPRDAEDPAEEAQDFAGGREIILVVEDQDDVREIAVALLEDLGYAVLQARCGREGLTTLQSDRPIDLLLTDIVMPGGINGTQLAEAARGLRPGLPIVFTTGYAEAAVLHEGEVKKASNLVTKPYRRVDLAAKIRQALEDRSETVASALPVAG